MGYKAIPYKKTTHHEAVIDSDYPWENTSAYNTAETRYYIVSDKTGEILDDAQGYGYKTAQKAYAAYAYKNRSKKQIKALKEKDRHIREWMNEHKEFVALMNQVAFEIAKGSWGPEDKFNAKIIKELLKNSELNTDFTAGDLLRVWQKGPEKKRKKKATSSMPYFVFVRNQDGNVTQLPYKKIKEHEESIIEDNINYGLIHAEYSEQDILDYKKQAYSEFSALKRAIRENPEIVLKLDTTTERYVPVNNAQEGETKQTND